MKEERGESKTVKSRDRKIEFATHKRRNVVKEQKGGLWLLDSAG
jgi:hypothetical protein